MTQLEKVRGLSDGLEAAGAPGHGDLLREPVPEQVRTGFGRVLLGLLVVFGAAVPVGMFAPGTRPWPGR